MKRNWGQDRQRQRMRTQGTEDVDHEPGMMTALLQSMSPPPVRPRRRKLTKAELRSMAERALARSPDVKITVCPPARRP